MPGHTASSGAWNAVKRQDPPTALVSVVSRESVKKHPESMGAISQFASEFQRIPGPATERTGVEGVSVPHCIIGILMDIIAVNPLQFEIDRKSVV